MERCCWKCWRDVRKSSSLSLSRSLRSMITGLVMSLGRWIRRLCSASSPSSSLSVLDPWRTLSSLNVTRGSKLWCLRPWNSRRVLWNSSSDDDSFSRSCRKRVPLTSRDTCFLAWNCRRLSLAKMCFRSFKMPLWSTLVAFCCWKPVRFSSKLSSSLLSAALLLLVLLFPVSRRSKDTRDPFKLCLLRCSSSPWAPLCWRSRCSRISNDVGGGGKGVNSKLPLARRGVLCCCCVGGSLMSSSSKSGRNDSGGSSSSKRCVLTVFCGCLWGDTWGNRNGSSGRIVSKLVAVFDVDKLLSTRW